MTRAEIDEEIERIRFYVHAYVDVVTARPEQRHCFPKRADFERNYDRNAPHFIEARRMHEDGRWSVQPWTGARGSVSPDAIAWRYHWSMYGVNFNYTPWSVRVPPTMRRPC